MAEFENLAPSLQLLKREKENWGWRGRNKGNADLRRLWLFLNFLNKRFDKFFIFIRIGGNLGYCQKEGGEES